MTFDAADLFRLALFLFVGLFFLSLIFVFALSKKRKSKFICAISVSAAFFFFLVYIFWLANPKNQKAPEIVKSSNNGPALQDDFRIRQEKANKLFLEKCQNAGEKIDQTVENVDGVVWMKWRSAGLHVMQYSEDDPYGKDCEMEGCIHRLLRGKWMDGMPSQPGGQPKPAGYKFVETADPRDGIRYRYTGIFKPLETNRQDFSEHVRRTGSGAELGGYFLHLQREPIKEFSARYGIFWDDISTREDRDYWIAGGILKIIDMKSNEAIGIRRGYLIDRGQGSTGGARDPWGWARHYGPRCPDPHMETFDFAIRVLKFNNKE